MKFDDLNQKMRVFETVADFCVLPGIFMVARLDGRSFTRLTKEAYQFEAPFDERFRDLMVTTAESLMTCGFRILYAYTESDEISLLFAPDEQLFNRKLRKYNSILAGEASARFSLALGQPAAFDCRISQLPTAGLVVDYFRWRNEDAARNALSAWCYETLRTQGDDPQQPTTRLLKLSTSQKNELLFQYGVNSNDLPSWQKRGVGLFWEEYEKPSFNPVTHQETIACRRRIRIDDELPFRAECEQFIHNLLQQQ